MRRVRPAPKLFLLLLLSSPKKRASLYFYSNATPSKVIKRSASRVMRIRRIFTNPSSRAQLFQYKSCRYNYAGLANFEIMYTPAATHLNIVWKCVGNVFAFQVRRGFSYSLLSAAERY